MTPRKIIGLILFLTVLGLSACGGGGGGGSSSGATIILNPTKAVALADGTDAATVQADVENADGTAAPDGTSVTFSASESTGPLVSTSAVTVNGKVSFSLSHAPITGATSMPVTITASTGAASSSTTVKFITQPASADVFIALNTAVTNLAGLQFNLNNTGGATFDNNAQLIFPMNNAATGSSAIVSGNFDSTVNSTKIALAFAGLSGFNTGTAPIIKATFAVSAVSTGLPVFSIDELSSTTTFTAVGPDFGATTPSVTAENLVVTVTFDTEK
jgi:Big-like domain-containing protein